MENGKSPALNQMKNQVTDAADEQSLVKLYMELTGTNESGARSVLMYVCPPEGEPASEATAGMKLNMAPGSEPELANKPRSGGRKPGATAGLALVGWLCLASAGQAASYSSLTNRFISTPLSLADAVNIALQQNPSIQRAQKDIEATEGIVLQTRAVAIPRVTATGGYNAVEKTDVDVVNIPQLGFSLGNDQNWSTQIKVVQSLYEGGRVASALRTARLAREQSKLNYDTTVSDAILAVEIGYYDVLLAEQQIGVQEASVKLLTEELNDTTNRFMAGTVPRFNVLRAEVELANAQPRLIRARNSFRIAKNNLANLLGFVVPREAMADIPLHLSGKLEAEPYKLDLHQALELALARRSELGALRKAEALRHEDVVSAQAGNKPSLQGFVGYDAHNSTLSHNLTYENHGWVAGVQLSWNIFDGMLTRGRVKQAQALYERAGVDVEDGGRRIELEVRTAHSNFIEAQEVIESQKKVVEEAVEAVRLAQARREAGTWTQLDVLSAQTALTDARNTQILALHDYASARARLERAVGMVVSEQK